MVDLVNVRSGGSLVKRFWVDGYRIIVIKVSVVVWIVRTFAVVSEVSFIGLARLTLGAVTGIQFAVRLRVLKSL